MSIEGQDTQLPEFQTAEQIINSLNPSEAQGQAAAPDAAVETIGGVSREQFLGALKEVGIEVPDVNVLKQRYEASGQVDSLRTQLQEFEAKSKISPYYSPLTESIDKMQREGKGVAEIKQFVELATLDLSSLSPVDAITRHYTLTKPGYTPDQINALIERDLGFDPTQEDELTSLQSATLKERQEVANTYLKAQQVQAENPEAVASARMQQETASRIVETWKGVIPTLKPNTSYNFTIGEEQIGFDFQPSSEALDIARNAVAQAISANPLGYIPNAENAKALQEMMEGALILADLPRFREALANHMHDVATKAAVQRYSGNGAPLNRNNGLPQVVPGAPAPTSPVGGWIAAN